MTLSVDSEHYTNTDTPAATVRGWALLVAAVGAIGCLTPLWPLGAGMVAVGLYVAPATKAVEPVEQVALEEAARGGGCGWLALTVFMIGMVGLLGVALLGWAVDAGVIR